MSYKSGVRGYRLKCQPLSLTYLLTYSHRRGFTLMELMVVIAIIVILAGIILPNYAKRVDRAKMVRAESDITAIETAIAMYANDMGETFLDVEGDISIVDTCLTGFDRNGTYDLSGNSKWNGPYLKGINKDPWGEDYRFFGKRAKDSSYGATHYLAGSGGGGETGLDTDDIPTLNYYIFSKGKNRRTGSGYNQDDINNWDVNKSWESYY